MDFLSLTSEYELYQEYLTKTKNTMKHVSNFFINFHKSLNEYATSIENSLNELLSNFLTYDKNITHIKKFFSFFQLFENHLLNLTSISKKILTEIISPTNEFTSFLSSENRRNLERLKKIINNTNIQKKRYDKAKESYFESCKLAEIQEKKLLEEMDKRENNNDEGVKTQNTILTRLRIQSQEEYQKYKDEHQKTNKLYEEYNKKYFGLINNIKDNEEKRINYLSFHIEKFISILKEEKNSLSNVIDSALASNEIDNKDQSLRLQLDEDMKIYKDNFNFEYKPNQRFLEEELLVYDIYRRRMEAIMNNNNLFLRNKKGLMASYMPTSIINDSNLNYLKDTQDYLSKFSSINLEQNDALIYKSIFDNNPLNINQKLFSNFENKLKSDYKFAQKIVDKIFSDYFRSPTIFYEFKNMDQFNRLSQILINVCLNKEIYNKIFELNYGIINIAEKGFIIEENSKNRKYLCQVLGQNCSLFKNKKHWKDLFVYKIDNTLKNLLNKEMEKEKEKEEKSTKKESKKNKEKEEEYKQLVEQKKKEIKEKNIFTIIQDFIIHFPNFNLDMSISNDLIMNVGPSYGLSTEEVKYLVCYINSNIYSIKSGYQEKLNHKLPSNLNEKDLMYYKSNYLLKNINNTNNIRFKKLLIILNSAFNFLYPKDYVNLLRVNKFFYENCEKKIYKNIFIKSDKSQLKTNLFDVNKHINMWNYYLKYDQKVLNYKDIISKFNNNPDKNYIYQETINMDVTRTYCESEQDKKRIMIKNILLSLSECYPKVGYCQGMNHICHFLLEITGNNEEKSFNIFSAIISKTTYDEIVLNDFKLMKKFFYVFDRLVSIYLPDLYVTINKINRVGACFYISPWFITLFTHGFQKNQTKLLLRVFDMFILDGWICIVRIGLVLLKYYQSNLVKMKYEELLQFLISELKEKYDFFGNYNYDKFIEMYHDMKIPKGLINNIENEYVLMQNIEKFKNNN